LVIERSEMKKSEFIALLETPKELGNHHIVGLQEAVKEFPYFQSAQLLLTKAFHKSENINFEGQLKKAAAFSSDRKRLHQLIFDQDRNLQELTPENLTESQAALNYPETFPVQKEEDRLHSQEPISPESNEESSLMPPFIPDFDLVAEDSLTRRTSRRKIRSPAPKANINGSYPSVYFIGS